MKSPLGKLGKGLRLHRSGDAKDKRDFLPSAQLDEPAQAARDMHNMRYCYDSLPSAAATNNAYEFSESLREMGSCLLEGTALHDDEERGELPDEDEFLWDDAGEEWENSSSLDREWQKRRDQYHTIGYREGLLAAKEAIAQEGFNAGFKQSVLVGYSWGYVRGVTGALWCLPDGLKEKLVETQEKRHKYQALHESVNSLSTMDALKLFHNHLMAKKAAEENQGAEADSNEVGSLIESSNCNQLEDYAAELHTLLSESPMIKSDSSIK